MTARTGYALFFDIDGTLFFDGKLSDENRDALMRVKRAGNLIFINTGRSRAWCPDKVINCGVDWDGFLCGSSYIEIRKKVYMNDFIRPDTVKRIVNFSFDYNMPVMLEGDRNYYTTWRQIVDSILIGEAERDIFLASEEVSRITKISFMQPLDERYYSLFPELYFIPFPTYTEGILIGHDKGTVIERVEEILDIPHEKTVAIGDSANDVAALDYAQTSVVIMHENSDMTEYPADIFSSGEPRCAVARVLEKMFPTEKEAEMHIAETEGKAEITDDGMMRKTKITEITDGYACPDECAVALGFFDGIHIGHKAILDRALAEAKNNGIKSAVLVFADTPDFKPNTLRIMSEEEKIREFSVMGFDYVFRCRFADVRNMSAKQFVREVILNRIGARCCVCGKNFRFGRGAVGDVGLLDRLMREGGGYTVACDSVEIVCNREDDKKIKESEKNKNNNKKEENKYNAEYENTKKGESTLVSSTYIRSLISEGRIDEANALTYANYSIDTEVEHGKALARTINSPTINQRFSNGVIIPKFGVYASRALVDGEYHISVSNVGIRPTFSEDFINCETHITGISENLYGKKIRVELLKYLRPEIKFSGIEELKNQIEKDTKDAVEYGKRME